VNSKDLKEAMKFIRYRTTYEPNPREKLEMDLEQRINEGEIATIACYIKKKEDNYP
jgi:hypothetical protein